MECSVLLSEELVAFPMLATTVEDAIRELVSYAEHQRLLAEPDTFAHHLIDREEIRSTHYTDGFLLPRGVSYEIPHPFICLGVFEEVVPSAQHFVRIVILFGAPAPKGISYMKTLSRLGRILNDPKKREHLKSAIDKADLFMRFNSLFQLA